MAVCVIPPEKKILKVYVVDVLFFAKQASQYTGLFILGLKGTVVG
jgi:hypothetical protein